MKKGSKMTAAHKAKISAAQKGRVFSDEHKANLSKSKKGKKTGPRLDMIGDKNPAKRPDVKTKISKTMMGKNTGPRPDMVGDKNPARQPGVGKKISKARKGKKTGPLSKAHKTKISESSQGRKFSDITKKKLSAASQGIPYDEWEAFACEKKYCPKFDEACRESNREKYGRRCFICNKTEKANGRKLSVHHVDMDKAQGCESNWKLVPLCMPCHATVHNNELIARLGYLIKGD